MRSLVFISFVAVGCGGTVVVSGAPSDGGVDDSHPATTAETGPVGDSAPFPSTGGVHPPSRPSTTAAGGETRWFVVNKVYLGIIDRVTGKVSPYAWMTYGYDLDGRATTADDSRNSTNSCKRLPGSQTKVLLDGENGRDDNFGQHIMAVVKSLKADAEDATNNAITSGTGATMLLRLDNVGASDNGSVPGALYTTVPTDKPPTFMPDEHFIVDSASIDSAKEPLVKFPAGYMSGGTWVSGGLDGRVRVSIPAFGLAAAATIDMPSGVMTFDVKSGKNGVIAGAIAPKDLIYGLTPALKAAGICPGNPTYDQVMETAVQSSDLVLGAPNLQDTAKECDAISLAIGFDVVPTGAGGGISGMPTPPDACH